MFKKILLFIFGIAFIFTNASATTITVACASNFITTLQQVAKQYNTTHKNVDIEIIQGSSSKLANQIKNGIPIDIFLSADKKYAAAVSNKIFIYAYGELILTVNKNKVKEQDNLTALLNEVEDSNLKISIANPNLAPYGSHAKSFLIEKKLWNNLISNHRIIYGENIGQAFSYFITNNAPIAFIADSQAKFYKKANKDQWNKNYRIYNLNSKAKYIAQYGTVISKDSKKQAQINSFLEYLLHSKKSKQIIKSMGYSIPK
ncbi:molybdate ABC transporter substrate-binding protein [Francisella halioticida]|uniref:Molybdate ABC transporter substrate-binding protein n=1 Tax=Francisella halioticida TaxID=549298 RepID=A0ABN5AU41_9GAMM|nr:molybdate ABC transporter substrate-binding protein [Francisella halioticida]ASG67170.1 molybdate ABC transporter substrate-binding protein [Francisella halioticida]BCD92127.1 molybdate ABC transporter substrate-binding protein [Francisella halioticida]